MENFDYEAHFEKGEMEALIEKVRAELAKMGVDSSLWIIEPWGFMMHIRTERQDLTPVTLAVYRISEVERVALQVEVATRIVLMTVTLSRTWFLEKKDGKHAHRRHPEEPGGSLA